MGTRMNCLVEVVLTSTHKLCFEQKYEKYQNLHLKIFLFLVVKLPIYLNRRVFVMLSSALYTNNKAVLFKNLDNIFTE